MNLNTVSLYEGLLNLQGCETLFLDRDSTVIERQNKDRPNKTANAVEECVINPLFLDVASSLAEKFRTIIVLSPSPSRSALLPYEGEIVNNRVRRAVERVGGRIDGFYAASAADGLDNEAMGAGPLLPLMARRDFPYIDFEQAVMVGDCMTDRMLAFNCGMLFYMIDDTAEKGAVVYDDEDSIEREMALLRGCTIHYIDTLQKFMNSHARMQGVRLASRCLAHAIGCGRRIHVVFGEDSGFNPDTYAAYLSQVVRESDHWHHYRVLAIDMAGDVGAQVEAAVNPGDVFMVYAMKSMDAGLGAAVDAARACGALTVSFTGAKPGFLDSTDVVVKVPSVMIAHVQGTFKMIAAMMHVLLCHELMDTPPRPMV